MNYVIHAIKCYSKLETMNSREKSEPCEGEERGEKLKEEDESLQDRGEEGVLGQGDPPR